MVCLGLEPRAAGRKVQMNPLSYGATRFKPKDCILFLQEAPFKYLSAFYYLLCAKVHH